MITNSFVNLPVKDLERSKKFFTQMGFKINEQFTNEDAACVVLGANIYAMLLTEKFFQTWTTKTIADTKTTTEVINAFFVDRKEEVDPLVDSAMRAGAGKYNEPQVFDFMYSRSFQDPDGHLWEIGWMDPKHIQSV